MARAKEGSSEVSLSHTRLGLVSRTAMLSFEACDGVSHPVFGSSKINQVLDDNVSDSYIEARQHRTPFATSAFKATHRSESFHSNIAGPTNSQEFLRRNEIHVGHRRRAHRWSLERLVGDN